MSTTITIGSLTYTLVAPPACAGIQSGELYRNDTVAAIVSPYTQATQMQAWQGGDWWETTLTPPPLTEGDAADWDGFLGELRGRLNVFQWVDPRRLTPRGSVLGVPVTASGNASGANTLLTSGWVPNMQRQILRGDRFQLGYRYYEACETSGSDGSGNMTIPIWPVLREAPASGVALLFASPQCLLRLKSNRRGSQYSSNRLSRFSLQAVEVR